MTRPRPRYRLIHGLLAALLLYSTVAPVALAQDNIYLPLVSNGQQGTNVATTNLLFRTQVTVNTPAQWQELTALDVVTLQQGMDWALLLVDDEQLTTLARLRYNPESTNALETLAATDPTVRTALEPLLTAAETLAQPLKTADPARSAEVATARQSLRSAMHALEAQGMEILLQAATVDADSDGLTDDQEGWWCTDPAKPDSDFDGTKDGAEVNALKAWMNNQRAAYPSSGKPFQGWPHQKTNCFDDDQDSVPDLAESLEIGLNPSRESTDRDKFDDGQELFGLTYCTGQGGFCSYGPLPRNEDWGVIFAEMPSWVKAPGNHPLVAAFPVPEVDVVQSSLKVETVTVVTTDYRIGAGTEKSYSTAKTEGMSSSVANTETWNQWQESMESREEIAQQFSAATFSNTPHSLRNNSPNSHRFEASYTRSLRQEVDTECKNMTDLTNQIEGATIGSEIGSTDLAPVSVSVHAESHVETQQGTSVNFNAELTGRVCQAALAKFCAVASEDDPYCYQDIPNIKITDDSRLTVQLADIDNLTSGLEGIQLAQLRSGQLIGLRLQELAYAVTAPRITTGVTNGTSQGGSRTITSESYEEHTVTNGEAFSNEESWGTATAVDSAHAADLTFTYKVRNTGTEYAREIANLAFNLYIGDDPNPAYTYFVAPDIGGSGKFANFMPTEEHTYTSRRIPLSLDQMKTIDLGAPIRIVVEDFTYGIDELFYQDAANAGVLIALEDGTDDGNETIDTYLIPTWGNETVLNILGRYFPNETDTNGTITAIWTPEYLNTTPTWCQSPRRPTDQPTKAVWCKHVLSTADWWNVYTDGLGDGSEGFQTTKATPGATALFRFNKDSDLDGFSDRSEIRLGTDPTDATSFPRPELLAGLHQIQNGTQVTATLSLLNTGIYDAYGVEAVMVAPDDSIAITNNTVGGSGRVKALKQVIVGSRVQLSALGNTPWSGQNNHAVPTVGGYYTGTTDRTYTFTVNGCAGNCTVGSGSWTLNWSDGTGQSGSLNMGAGYQSPTFQTVGDLGVTLALYSGAVSNGESFTVQATTPRDTFQYTVNREPHSEPLVIVSYNDPQGNHRFVLPPTAVHLAAPTENLQEFAGQMRQDIGVELVTDEPFDASSNPQSTLSLLVNNPSDATLNYANLFLEFINISGTVVTEIPTQVTLPPGPTSTTVNFDSRTFDPPYEADQDYIIMAFLTDYQGNILGTAGRPLSSFQVDPLPTLAADNQTFTWDFGTVAQGTLLQHELAIANEGYGRLYTYLSPTPGLTLNGTGQRTVGAADTGDYQLQLDTLPLPVGPYSQTVTLHTSDPDSPALTLSIQGIVNAGTPDIPASALQRPLDVAVVVTGTHSQGEWIEFIHTLEPDSASLHPVKVYDMEYSKLWGIGKYALAFRPTPNYTSSMRNFSELADLRVPSGEIHYINIETISLSYTAISGQSSLFVDTTTRVAYSNTVQSSIFIEPGSEVLIIQNNGSNIGAYEFATVQAYSKNLLTLQSPIRNTYLVAPDATVQVVLVPKYREVTGGGTIKAIPWNGNSGGIVAFHASSISNITLDVSGQGYFGGYGNDSAVHEGGINCGNSWATQGASPNGSGGCGGSSNGGGGGAGSNSNGAGGGGGYGTTGTNGNGGNSGQGGSTYGNSALTSLYMGAGGGGGSWGTNPYGGGRKSTQGNEGSGRGGGIIFIESDSIANTQFISNGNSGGNSNGSYGGYAGGGGAGGSIKLVAIDISNISAQAIGGAGGNGTRGNGGSGGSGRIRIEYCNSPFATNAPSASFFQRTNCYIIEQYETSPYTTARLSLPEAVNGTATYNVQFGRKLDFDAAGEQVTTLRLPAGMVSSAYLDALVSGLPANATLTLDIGNDGSVEFQETIENNSTNQTANLGAALSSYWQTHGSPLIGTLDVPIKVGLNQPGQVLLTNVQVQTVGSQVRQVRLPVDNYATFSLDFTLGGAGAVALDIGDNGSIDWVGNVTTLRQVTGNLATMLNAYLSGKSGEVDLPVRFFVNPASSVTLNHYSSTINRSSNLVAQQIQIGAVESQVAAAANGQILEGDRVHVSGTLRNSGNLESGPLTAAFFAEASGWGDWYIGSAFIANLPAGSTITVETLWNTTGFSGTIPVKMVVNPYGRIVESSYADNAKSTSAAVLLLQTGDINADRATNIFDLQHLINMILHETQPDSALYAQAYWSRADLNNDDEWNIFDLQKLINLILQEAE